MIGCPVPPASAVRAAAARLERGQPEHSRSQLQQYARLGKRRDGHRERVSALFEVGAVEGDGD